MKTAELLEAVVTVATRLIDHLEEDGFCQSCLCPSTRHHDSCPVHEAKRAILGAVAAMEGSNAQERKTEENS